MRLAASAAGRVAVLPDALILAGKIIGAVVLIVAGIALRDWVRWG